MSIASTFAAKHPLLQKAHDLLVYGALSKEGIWGGPECAKAVSMETHIYESACWILLSIVTYYLFNCPKYLSDLKKTITLELAATKQHPVLRFLECTVGSVHLLMFFQLIYYKFNISSLINLFQPCHVILLLQGLALFSDGVFGMLVAIFILPALTGTMLAMLFPATEGLDQPFEMEAYWIQHYFIQIVPLYLLLRKNGLALKHTGLSSALFGLWILMVLHFFFFEIVDVLFNVNVEFMLCPTEPMVVIFANFPQWVIYPSYRTTLTFGVYVIGITMTFLYMALAYVVKFILPGMFKPTAVQLKKMK